MSVRRFGSILAGNFWDLVKLNLLFCLSGLLSAALFFFGISGVLGGFAFILALAAAFPVGGACSACLFGISKMLRGDPGYLWYDFKRKFRENMKQAAAPGILCTAFVYAEILLGRNVLLGGASAAWIIAGLIPFVVFGMVTPYLFLQIAYIELKISQILKNSLIIAFAHTGRSLVGALMGGAIWAVYVVFLPGSLVFTPLLLIIGFSVPWLLNLVWVWPPLDKQFAIAETLRNHHPGGE